MPTFRPFFLDKILVVFIPWSLFCKFESIVLSITSTFHILEAEYVDMYYEFIFRLLSLETMRFLLGSTEVLETFVLVIFRQIVAAC